MIRTNIRYLIWNYWRRPGIKMDDLIKNATNLKHKATELLKDSESLNNEIVEDSDNLPNFEGIWKRVSSVASDCSRLRNDINSLIEFLEANSLSKKDKLKLDAIEDNA